MINSSTLKKTLIPALIGGISVLSYQSYSSKWIQRIDLLPESTPASAYSGTRIAGPYADYLWPLSRGGIASLDRVHMYSLREWVNLPSGERTQVITKSSPSIKYDLWKSDYQYNLFKSIRYEAQTVTSIRNQSIGSSFASLWLREPIPKTVKNADGIEVSFGSSDVKALIGYFVQKKVLSGSLDSKMKVVGDFFSSKNDASLSAIPSSEFHLTLGNHALKPMVLRITDGKTSLYKALFRYQVDYRYWAEGKYKVKADLEVGKERAPSWEPYGFFSWANETLKLEYLLQVNSKNEVIHGDWLGRFKVQGLAILEPATIREIAPEVEGVYEPYQFRTLARE